MSDIELVIKIPEHLYSVIKNKECTHNNVLTEAVFNGTVLPKGHGDLIDRSKLVYGCSFSEYGCDSICHCDGCYYAICKARTINSADIIIKAGKGEGEEK